MPYARRRSRQCGTVSDLFARNVANSRASGRGHKNGGCGAWGGVVSRSRPIAKQTAVEGAVSSIQIDALAAIRAARLFVPEAPRHQEQGREFAVSGAAISNAPYSGACRERSNRARQRERPQGRLRIVRSAKVFGPRPGCRFTSGLSLTRRVPPVSSAENRRRRSHPPNGFPEKATETPSGLGCSTKPRIPHRRRPTTTDRDWESPQADCFRMCLPRVFSN